jgi:dipeptidyl aminopeptidase/acylaminoacyl peptidase
MLLRLQRLLEKRFGTHPLSKAVAILSSAALLGLTVLCEFASSQTTGTNAASPITSILTFGAPALVSTSPSGAAGNGSSFHANFSPDGKRLLFWSNSTNFVSGLTNGNQQLYIKDLTTSAIALVSADANGVEGNNLSLNVNNSAQVLMFSPDGTQVVFESSASNLVPGSTNGSQQIFLKDLTTGAVTLVSADANGVQGNDDSLAFSFSPDGTKIVFDSSASNLLPGGTHTQDVFLKDLTTGAVTLVSTLAAGSHVLTAVYSGDAAFSGASSAPFTETVQYAQAGTACDGQPGHQILPPIDPAGSSVFKQRRTIPAQFRVCDANGVSIGTPGVVSNFSLIQILTGTVLTKVLENVYTNNPDTAFRWDPTSQQWIFNISNADLAAGSTYFYAITLNDGSVIYFQYGLR